MSISSTPAPVTLARRTDLRAPGTPWDAVVAWTLSFGLVFYLALRGGGFDAVVRDDVGILVWWVVLLMAVAGLAPRITRAGWLAIAALAAWAAWTTLGISGSASHERALSETGRLSAYVGVLILALALQGRSGARHVVNGVATAMGAAAVLAVLSRMHPQWFPDNAQTALLPGAVRRLSYPLNYWNGLACFLAMAATLLLGVGATARTRLGQALAVAVVPLCVLGVVLTVSRAGAALLVIGPLVYLVLTTDRLAALGTVLVGATGGTILLVAAHDRPEIRTGLDTAAARSDGSEMIWLALIVCAGTALLQVAIGLLARHARRPAFLVVSPRTTAVIAGVVVVAAVAIFFGSSLHHDVADRFREFKAPPTASNFPGQDNVFDRLQSSAGEGRWQFWQVAVDAFEAHPLRGIGGNNFALYWQNHATVDGSINDAHNLYVQTLAETGLIGAAALTALLLLSVVGGIVRTVRSQGTARMLAAAATAAMVVFWVEAAIDWVWQLAVLPAALLLLMAAVLGTRDPEPRPARMPVRVLAVAAAIVAFLPIAFGLSTVVKVRSSQAAANQGRLADALTDAQSAERVPGTSTTAVLQQALVLERGGDLRDALTVAVRATALEPTNWSTWLVRSRLEARLDQDRQALADFRRARALNPRSPLFTS